MAFDDQLTGKGVWVRVGAAFGLTWFLLLSAPARAGHWHVHGIGNDSCGMYLAAAAGNEIGTTRRHVSPDGIEFHDNAYAYGEWLNGYFTGLNLLQPDDSNQFTLDNIAISVWVKNYCNQHPTDALLEAAAALWRTRRAH